MISSPDIPQRPDSLLSLDLEDGEANSDEGRPTSTSTGATTDSSNSTAPTSMSHSSTTTGMTKRYHALHELLSSERAYASDLALIREVHIPLALGEVFDFCQSSTFTPRASRQPFTVKESHAHFTELATISEDVIHREALTTSAVAHLIIRMWCVHVQKAVEDD